LRWISSGHDPEYDPSNWLFAHAQLLWGIGVFAFVSLGFIPFLQGFYEVDLMNFYVGRLLVGSQSQTAAVLEGWHAWSMLRGVAYTFLVYEIVSLSLERLRGRRLSTAKRRRWRWAGGLLFFALDCMVKYAAMALQSGPGRRVGQ
jgi:hypothetical protein